MTNFLKRVFILVLLVAFMIPASGLMVYVHHCNMSNYTQLDLESSNTCCGASNGETASCSRDDSKSDYTGTSLSAPPCCVESNLFLKLKSEALLHSLQLMQAGIAVLPSMTNINIQFSDEISSNEILSDFRDYPPGNEHYIMFSSLRL